MPYFTTGLAPHGPIVTVLFGVTAPKRQLLEKMGFPVPERVEVRALLDTGSGITALDPSIALRLDLSSHGTAKIFTPSTGASPHECRQLDVSVTIPHPDIDLYIPFPPAIESQFQEVEGVKALLGRDILGDCLFIYDGQSRTFSLAF